MATTFTCTTAKKVNIRKSASSSAKIVGSYKANTKLKLTDTKTVNGYMWGKTDKGWILLYDYKNSYCSKLVASTTNSDGSVTKSNLTNTITQYNTFLNDIYNVSVNDGKSIKKTMQLFGLPYQFLESVDHRIDTVSPDIGRKFVQNIILDAPILTVLPGKADYLPGTKDKVGATNAFLSAAAGSFKDIAMLTNKDEALKYYDFKTDYIKYMSYVNILCRSCAALLELDKDKYIVNGKSVNFLNFDWKDYRWSGQQYQSSSSALLKKSAKSAASLWSKFISVGSDAIKFFTGNSKKEDDKIDLKDTSDKKSEEELETIESLLKNVHFVQFYIDPEQSSVSEDIGNSTTQSSLKGMVDGASQQMKEIAFMANTGGVDTEKLGAMGDNMITELSNALGLSSTNDSGIGISSLLSRILKSGNNIVHGENIIMPDIYSSSSYSKSYSFTVHLKAMYGNKYSYYMDVLVPLMHLLALALPQATSANSYKSPFLVKAYAGSAYVCNLGMVTSININKASSTQSMNVDGLYTEMDVTVSIADLYSDLAMTPSGDPILFLNNTSLIDYLAISCGLNLIESQFTTKMSLLWENLKNVPKDYVDDNVFGSIGEKLDDILYGFTGL